MSTERARRALELLEQALAVSDTQRTAWVDEACGEDRDLADEVHSLLAAHGNAEGFLESGITQIAPTGERDEIAAGDLTPGRQLGDFVVQREIGAGGMGLVYRARQVSLNRVVALKVLPPYLRYSESARTRFRREIEAAASLQHRNIVAVYTTGEELGATYYAMELIEGPALSELIAALRQNPLPELKSCRWKEQITPQADAPTHAQGADATPPPAASAPPIDLTPLISADGYFKTVARLVADVADGLGYAHAQQIVHRDVKPSNLLFSADGEIHLSDFGLARIAEQPGLTRTGEVIGTPFYMAPEQIAAGGGEVDGRTDIYALGATLYELLTLRPPFVGESRHQVISQIATQDPAAPRSCNPSVPRDLETICLRAIEKLPGRRYQSAAALADDLRCFAEDLPIAARPAGRAARALRVARRHRGAVAALTAMSALLAATAFFAFRSYQSEARWTDAEFDRVFETAQFAAMEGNLDGARVAIDQAEALGATAAQLNLLRGQLALREGQYQDACDQLEEAVEELPHSVAAHALLSQAYDANEENDKMTAALRRLERLQPVTLQDYLLLGQARIYNDFDAGLMLLNEAVEQDKTNVVARLVRGSALVYQAKVTGEAEHAEAALDDLRIASELLRRNAFLLGRTLEARLTAATAYHHQGDLARMRENVRAAGEAAEALADFPENYLSHRWRAFYFDYIGDDEQALASWRAMQEARIAYLVIALFRHGQFDEALRLCDERLQRFKNARFTDFFRAIVLAAQADTPDAVLGAFVRAGEETLDVINAHRFNYVVRCLAGQLNEAQQYCRSLRSAEEQFVAHDPWRVHLLDYTCGAIDDAKLLHLASDSRLALTQARFYLGTTWLALGDRAKASDYFAASAEDKSLGILENHMSRAFLAQLQREPKWPRWIDEQDAE